MTEPYTVEFTTPQSPPVRRQRNLTRAQAVGLACLHCGGEAGPHRPIGRIPGIGQVFTCAESCGVEL